MLHGKVPVWEVRSLLVLLLLLCLPILATPGVAAAEGHHADFSMSIPFAGIAVLMGVALLRSVRARES